MVNGCLYLAAEGCRWRSLPKDFGPWQTVRGYHDRFHRDCVWAEIAAVLTPAARQRLARNAEPSTGIIDSQSVVSGPQKGGRGFDGNKRIKGIKRHVLTCSFGFILAVLVTAANVHDSHAFPTLRERSRDVGWSITRVNVDGIYQGETVDKAAARHQVKVQIAARDPASKEFTPLTGRGELRDADQPPLAPDTKPRAEP
jgi:putative transposase